MPIYEYQCQQCGHHHEALQKISDPQLRQCPECGRKALKRLVSAVRFRLAGSGWYETDFKSDKESKRNLHEKGDREEAKPAASSDAGAAEASKPEPKAETPKTTAPSEAEPRRRTTVTRPAAVPSLAKANGRTRPARRAPAQRQRRR
jgi:putative FmdB family regulatory protein